MSTAPMSSRVRMTRIAEQAVERARLSVVPRLRRRTPRVPFVILLSLLLVAGVVGLLMFNTTMQQNSFTATALEKQVEDLTARRQGLQMELDQLNNPQRVAERAKALGMVEGPVAGYIDLRDGSVSGEDLAPAGTESQFSIRPPTVKKPEQLTPERKIKWVDPKPKKKNAERKNPEKPKSDTADASSDQPAGAGSNGASGNQPERSNQGDRSNR